MVDFQHPLQLPNDSGALLRSATELALEHHV
jgi:hypothetical protein